MSITLQQWLDGWQGQLPPDSPTLDLRLIIAHITGISPTAQRLRADQPLDAAICAQLDALAQRRAQGEPLAYILGHQPFYDLDLHVTPATLIPRADTEILVDAALARLPEHTPCTVIDLGTGSGAIALTLAKHRPHARVIATDMSLAALHVAQDNARRHHLGNCHFLQSDWLAALAAHSADLIVSNPPYIAARDPHLSALTYEPQSALIAKEQGLADIRRILADAPRVLKTGGWLLFEHGYDQRDAIAALIGAHWQQHDFLKDYGGNWRVCLCQKKY